MPKALKEQYADLPWDRDRRRTRALTRDEHRLRETLAAHEARRFDLDTAQVLRERTEDLLETERAGGYAPPDAAEIERARRAARQLGRLEDVLADAGQLDHDARLGIGAIARVLDFYLRPVPETRPDLDGALHAADWLAHAVRAAGRRSRA